MDALLQKIATDNGLILSFAVIGLVVFCSGYISRWLTMGRIQGSAIAILIGLALAYVGGRMTGGSKGLADISYFSGIALLG